jgi:eukaryotic-like serine/threonine-protein kinase
MAYGLEALLKHREDIDSELRKHKSPVTIMFTDLAGSTTYFDRHGDTAGVEWLEKHNSIVIPIVTSHGGVVVKTIGDSVMAYFVDAGQATAAARDIQKHLFDANHQLPPDEQMQVRVALHQGLGYLRGGDVFGDVVNVAARLTKVCLPAQVLLSESVYRSVQQTGEFQCNELGSTQIRGKKGTETLYELAWTDPGTYTELRLKFPPKSSSHNEELSEGRYQVLSELGRGAMGVVYKAYDRSIGRLVAMKTIPIEVDAEHRASLVERLKQEARAAGILDHPHIITIFDVGEEGGLFYFTMQYVEGRTLSSLIEAKELMSVDKVIEFMEQTCSAVEFAHTAGIVHRDLKPSNLMLTKSGAAKVLDFGIAKLGDAGLTKAGLIIGTPSYLSPEQAGGRRIDHRSDIFSLGSVMYELLTGERAFPGESTSAIVFKVMNEDPIPPIVIEPSLPPGLDAIVRKALAKDPGSRFQSCEEMLDALKHCKSRIVQVPPRTTTTRHVPESSGNNTVKWVGAAIALVVIVAAGYFYMGGTLKPVAPKASEHAAVTVPAPQEVSSPPTPIPASVTEDSKNAVPEMKPPSTKSARKKEAAKPKSDEGEDSDPPAAGYFSKSDIPTLLAKADAYAGRGDYQKAIIVYQEILRFDSKNSGAKDGLRRAREAQGIRH